MLTGILASIGIKEAEAWAKRLTPFLIALGIIAAVGISWLIFSTHYRNQGIAQQKDRDQSIITSWHAAFYQSDANFRVAIAAVNQQNADSLARATAFNASKLADAKNIAAANDAWEKSESSRAALADIVKSGKSGCKPSAKLLNAIGDDI